MARISETSLIPPEQLWMNDALMAGGNRLSKKTKKPYFDAREWTSRQLALRTDAALKQKNAQFSIEHSNDTDEQLLAYLRECAEKLGHTPHPEEIIGGAYISYRFDSFYKAALSARLPSPGRHPAPHGRKIYQDELKEQAKLYQKERAEIKAQRAAEREKRCCAAKKDLDARMERDCVWGQEHQNDTDEQLLEYVRCCAQELGHTPYTREIVGGEYIRSRFGGWALMLTLAGLPLPSDVKPPTQQRIKDYKEKRKTLVE